MKDSYDCIVVGGGPAGSTVAALVAQGGFSTLLVEREKMPRFHVGESLMPETYWPLKRLGVLEKMKNSRFVKKMSVQFITHSGKESQPFFFNEHDPHESSQTWQVWRADFDQMLFDNAREKGADCYDQTRLREVLVEDDRANSVRLELSDGSCRKVQGKVIVDATGQRAFLANQLDIREDYSHLKKAAIWGYYRGARRDPGEHGGGTIIIHTNDKKSWFWFIPLADDLTSIGVVADNDYLLKDRGKPASAFEDELVKCPGLVERLMDAELTSRFRVAKEFSYHTRRQAGDGWVLVGDAFGFIDPIYSTGVYFALKTGEQAADAIVEGLQNNDTSAAQLGNWTDEFKAGVQWISKLVDAYYTNEFSFGRFMRDFPNHRGNLTDLLIGRIFHEGAGKIFDDMDPLLKQARSSSNESKPMSTPE